MSPGYSVAGCRTEYLVDPLGLDTPHPRLSWRLEAEERGFEQSAYHVLVASSEEKLARDIGDLWDSGMVPSTAMAHIEYAGLPLQSECAYYWKTRVRDREGNISAWSTTAQWTMGLLKRGEWRSRWIGRRPEPSMEGSLQPCPFFRKVFTTRGPIKRALVHATALGVYELYVNGVRIGGYFAPGWTDYEKRVQVQTYDITDSVREGDNVFGAVLGDGWYAGTVGFLGRHVYGKRPLFLLQASIEYEDGRRERVTTDGSWRTSDGPIRYSDMIKGECYDARLELTGWNEAGYDDSGWAAPEVRSGYNGMLTAALEPPIRILEERKPVSIRRTEAGTFIFDMGQNMVGWTEIAVTGKPGGRIVVSHAEMLNPDGTLYLDNLRQAVQQDCYICRGTGEVERYEPHFTFHGFRYVELIGFEGEADLDTITGKVVHSDTPVTGTLETSDDMINRLYRNIVWGQRGNFLSVPTDCPQRDERLGWTGDAQIFARTASYNMDVSRFFTKYMLDIADCQQASGAFTDVAPDAGWIRHKMWNDRLNWFAPDNSGWGDAGVIIPWTLYTMYGDTRILSTHYEAMQRWMAYLEGTTDGLVRPGYANYADWLSIGENTPNEVLATAYFAYDALLMSRIAAILGHDEDSGSYGALHEKIAAAFRGAFVAQDGTIYGDTQTVYVLALSFGLLTETLRDSAISRLVGKIRANGDRLTTGFLGVGYLLPALTDHGRADIAYSLLKQEQFPSWMYSIRHGATTIWERWDGWTEEKGFQTPGMNSFNHYSLGSVGEWMYRYMAGIEADPDAPGFARTIIRPHPGGGLQYVRAAYESLYGEIRVSWHREGERFRLEVTIPPGTKAKVVVPGRLVEIDGVRLGAAEAKVKGCEKLSEGDAGELYGIGSGTYLFVSVLPAEAAFMTRQGESE
ncbi:alpha-L-rhamnosidase [Paenibacillus mucilaginosus 3016]|uniref:alpha-L-rhamnosidase n=1 Tax=Paenibacillus mucilaginosus 3016 TaxID=1116391 RepID=H6NDA1_9BACL|nr:glycoside hydrolase family 78 protein [Paenibacillus mucilaginosus]AFC30614.1 alpha-L-rhamnosidase [Paenibacillus mucilaginosus 3016]WFA19229.1 alpha-L-rhamnosidase [Paenibacillus mucilaginosus]